MTPSPSPPCPPPAQQRTDAEDAAARADPCGPPHHTSAAPGPAGAPGPAVDAALNPALKPALKPANDASLTPTLDPAVQSACLRLGASRAQLRLALHGPASPAAAQAAPPGWWAGLLAVPAVRVLRDAAQGWWARHPWHAAGSAAATAVNAALRPVARRHPWALVAAALLAGGLVGATRPWRWRARLAAGSAGSLPRLLNEVLAALPVASWLVMLATLAQAAAAAAQPPPAAAPGPASPEP